MEEIITNKPEAIVFFIGDLNHLKTYVLENELEIIQVVKQPTHADHILDKFFTNRIDSFDRCRVVASLIPTKHKAILINYDSEPTVKANMEKRVIKFYVVRQPHIDNLNQALCTYNWTHLTIDRDIDSVYNAFILFAPQKRVTLSSNTASFVTPLIKLLLRKRNKLMRCGHLQKLMI